MTNREIIDKLKNVSLDVRFEAIKYLLYDLEVRKSFLGYIKKTNGLIEDAEDAIQEAVLKLLVDGHNLKLKEDGNVRGYFDSMIRNNWRTYLKKKKNISPLKGVELPLLTGNIQDAMVKKDSDLSLIRFVQNSLGQLKKLCQDILKLDALDYTNEDIAITLNLTNADLARKYKYRCRKTFKKKMGDNFDWKVFLH